MPVTIGVRFNYLELCWQVWVCHTWTHSAKNVVCVLLPPHRWRKLYLYRWIQQVPFWFTKSSGILCFFFQMLTWPNWHPRPPCKLITEHITVQLGFNECLLSLYEDLLARYVLLRLQMSCNTIKKADIFNPGIGLFWASLKFQWDVYPLWRPDRVPADLL